jgi:hypothetical protein
VRQATQSHPVLAPVELRYDLPAEEIGDAEMPECRNTTLENGQRVKRYGYPRLGSNLPLSGACLGGDYFTLFSGTRKLILGTVADVYSYNSTTKCWEIITDAVELDAGDAGWTTGQGDTVTHDTSVKVRGTGAMKLVFVAGRAPDTCLAYKDISSADIHTHNSIGFWIRSSLALAAGAVKVVVSESNHAAG